MMEIQITATNIRYEDGEVSAVHVQFQGRDSEGTVNLSGYIPLTPQEYLGNEALSVLKNVVRTKLIDKLQLPVDM
jgi:hypothetical protein